MLLKSPKSDKGIVTSPGKLRFLWPPGNQRDEENAVTAATNSLFLLNTTSSSMTLRA